MSKYIFNCSNCGLEWDSYQEGSHNDKCPECGVECSPSYLEQHDKLVSMMNDEQYADYLLINHGDIELVHKKMPSFDCVFAAMKRHRRENDRSGRDGLYHLRIDWEGRKIEELDHYGLMEDEKKWDY